MMELEHKADTMQANCEAPGRCLHSAGYFHDLQYSMGAFKGFPELNEGNNVHPSGDTIEPDSSNGSEHIDSSKESPEKPVQNNAFGSWSAFYPDSNNMHLFATNAFEAQFHPYAVDNQFHYVPFNVFYQQCPREFQFQDFQYFVVIDFEATCNKEKNPHPQEIIEFPSVIVSSMSGQLEACFQTYVRPTCNQLLSDFCKDLTGIEQIQVDRGVTLTEALLRHDKWLEKKGIKNSNFAVVTWSNWDCRVILESECRYKKIRKPPYFNRWINLKVPFRDAFGGMRCNLKEAMQIAGLAWQGRAHCGLDDAKNTARLLALLMHRGFKLSITDALMYRTTNESFAWKLPLDHQLVSPYEPQKARQLHVPTAQIHPYCFCGMKSSKGVVQKPGPKQGSLFFGCGNWTAGQGASCHFFKWDSP
ncbi:ERI1 exoribonuclease 2-like isoform X1 [Ipomoea triloba]|uniref:ERI1 exoribonuclease 2-like isoform X1 n=1 Tax=Ipomoea triloba TaxID=35885 RepID=UPI00125E5DE5|nr:ERI1 exoribonuclease 2-like isoform X1 [Ipomoea triloba]